MTLFSWFNSREEKQQTLTFTSDPAKRLSLNTKSMWPIAKVHIVKASVVDSHKNMDVDLLDDNLANDELNN